MDQEETKKISSEESEKNGGEATELEKELVSDDFESISIDLPFDDEEIKDKDSQSDELWDPTSELDDVSLFDEFASEIAEIEKAEKDKTLKKSSSREDHGLSSLLEAEEEKTEIIEPKKEELILSSETEEKNLIPLIISGIACIFLFAGIYTAWKLIYVPFTSKTSIKIEQKTQKKIKPTPEKHEIESQNPAQGKIKPEKTDNIPVSEKQEPVNNLPHFETIALSSFMIPATQNGKLVFFNIQISLMVADQHIKKEFIKRETRIRDTIYRELKGADLSKGVDENTLIMFRKPLIDKINEEYSPLKVEDIKLTGYILI